MKKISVIITVLLLCVLFGCSHKHRFEPIITTAGDCSVPGYTYRTCETCGFVEYIDQQESVSHNVLSFFDDIRFQNRYGTCAECGVRVYDDDNYQPPAGIDRLYVYGVVSSGEIPIEMTYVDYVGEECSGYNIYGLISKDTNESNIYSKRDYDLSFFSDSEREKLLSLNFDHSLSNYDTYALKSEYADVSSVRNISASSLWSAVTSVRTNINENLAQLPGYGADAGFPVLLYTNNNYKGIYNLCKPNDGQQFGLSDNNNHALIFTNRYYRLIDDTNYVLCNDDDVWCQVKYPEEQEDRERTRNQFNDFTDFVINSSDSQFKKSIEDYLDVEAAIDYLICVYAFGADENANEFCNWVTYDGKKWIPSMYNIVHSFGIKPDGQIVDPQDTICPYYENGVLVSGTDNILFDRLCKLYEDEIRSRYSYLRPSLLSKENVKAIFDMNISRISDAVYDSEFEEYPEKKTFTGSQNSEDIADWFDRKAEIVDAVLLND